MLTWTRRSMVLIITRKSGESVQFGDNIKITVLDDKHTQVKVGIEGMTMVNYGAREFMRRFKNTI